MAMVPPEVQGGLKREPLWPHPHTKDSPRDTLVRFSFCLSRIAPAGPLELSPLVSSGGWPGFEPHLQHQVRRHRPPRQPLASGCGVHLPAGDPSWDSEAGELGAIPALRPRMRLPALVPGRLKQGPPEHLGARASEGVRERPATTVPIPVCTPTGLARRPAKGMNLLHSTVIWLWMRPLTDTDLRGPLRAMARCGAQGSGDMGVQHPGSSSCQRRSDHLPRGCEGWAWGSPSPENLSPALIMQPRGPKASPFQK